MATNKKMAAFHGVAVMESPDHDRFRASTGFTRNSEGSNPELYDMNMSKDPYGGALGIPYDYDGLAVMSEFNHDLYKSPHQSAPSAYTATTGTAQRQKYRVLGTLSLVGIVYFATCGGPVGSEPIISAGGPLLGLLGVVVYALFCQIPLSLMITELCCAFPENGGYSVWAMTALGPYSGFQIGYWSWVASVLNNAIYPGLIYDTIVDGYDAEATSTVAAWFAKAAIAVILAIPSYLGVRFVGISAVIFLVIVLLSTLMFTAWGFADGDGAWFRLKEIRSADQVTDDSPDGGIDWSLLIHALFWSFDGLYDVSVIGGEVLNPARTYPRVILAAVVLTVLTFTLPYIAAVTADKMPWLEYAEDSYPTIADAIGGPFLHQTSIIASVIASIGMFTCTLFFQSFLVQGMAQSRLLPTLLRKRNQRFRTPQYAITLSLVVTIALVGFDFESILNMTNAFSGMVQIMIVVSMLMLRKHFPYLPRPVKVPGNMVMIMVMLVPATAVFVYAIVSTLMDWKLALVVVGFAIPGLIYPLARQRLAGGGCC